MEAPDRFYMPKASTIKQNGRVEYGMPSRPTRLHCGAQYEATKRLQNENDQDRYGVARQAEAQELAQVRAVNRCRQGQLHNNRTSDDHPLVPTGAARLAENQSSGTLGATSAVSCCSQRYQGRLQAQARAHQADHVADEKHHTYRLHQQDALRHVQDNLGVSNKLTEQYPHGLPRGMLRRLKLEHNFTETPGRLGFGFYP